MLSIVIPTHNRTDLLRACLLAVVRHAPQATEIIVVDDASPYAAASRVAAEFGAMVLRSTRQRGFAMAANAGIRASRGEVVEMLNDDTEVQPGWADAALKWFDDASVGAVAPLVLAWPDGDVIDSAGDTYYFGGVARKRWQGVHLRRSISGPGSEREAASGSSLFEPCRVFGTSAAAGFYRRSALDRADLFPEEFGSYFEDVDLAFRLNRAGYRTTFEPASRVLHHVSASYGTEGRRLIERQSCNEERVFWRNLPTSVLWQALPKHLAVLIGKAWRRLDEGTLLPWLFGKLRAFSEWGTHRAHCSRLPTSDTHDWSLDESWSATET
ncbi:MAG: glycosyltransferase family 2 protein [Planctomycetes bacterium]|nr:glycosyltransferase family 2 protein [Planctomycetota bacterium]